MSFAKAICSGSGVDVPDEVVCKESAASDSEEEEVDGSGARAAPVVGGIVGGVLAAMALL